MFYFLVPMMVFTFALMLTQMRYRWVYGYYRKSVNGMSWPSKQILRGYNDLPADSKPHANILFILRTLDERHGVDSVNAHFTYNDYDTSRKTMDRCNCHYTGTCSYQGYKDMYRGISNVKTNIDMRQKAVLESKTNFIDDDIKTFKEDLKRESVLLEEQRRELSR